MLATSDERSQAKLAPTEDKSCTNAHSTLISGLNTSKGQIIFLKLTVMIMIGDYPVCRIEWTKSLCVNLVAFDEVLAAIDINMLKKPEQYAEIPS